MILHPLSNSSVKFLGGFGQKRPRVTQKFGENPQIYTKYGHKGHNGCDFGPDGNETLYGPFGGQVKVGDQGDAGYGKYVKIRDGDKELTIGHLREIFVLDGQKVHMGEKLGLMGNTGFSTAKHTHITLKFTENAGSLWSRKVLNQDNGFGGAIDPLPYMITWKGTHLQTDL